MSFSSCHIIYKYKEEKNRTHRGMNGENNIMEFFRNGIVVFIILEFGFRTDTNSFDRQRWEYFRFSISIKYIKAYSRKTTTAPALHQPTIISWACAWHLNQTTLNHSLPFGYLFTFILTFYFICAYDYEKSPKLKKGFINDDDINTPWKWNAQINIDIQAQ